MDVVAVAGVKKKKKNQKLRVSDMFRRYCKIQNRDNTGRSHDTGMPDL